MICPGRITGGGGRINPLSANYVLSYRERKLAVIEAKRAPGPVPAIHEAFIAIQAYLYQ